VPPILGRQLP